MKVESDPLEKYVFGVAWFLLILGILMLPFPFVAEGPFAERIEAYPDFIQNLFFIYYVVFGIFGGLCSILVYPIAYVIPAIVYLSRYFQAKPQKKQRLGFVLFVLLFFPGIIVMLFRTPFNIV